MSRLALAAAFAGFAAVSASCAEIAGVDDWVQNEVPPGGSGPGTGGASDGGGSPASGGGAVGAGGAGGAGGATTGGGGKGGEAPECTREIECGLDDLCVDHACLGGYCKTSYQPSGTPCDNGKKCDELGHCVSCITASDCPADQECASYTCNGGNCDIVNVQLGIYCSDGVGDGIDQCDGGGQCVDCVTNAGCDRLQLCSPLFQCGPA